MYTFEDLVGKEHLDTVDSLAYWIGVVSKNHTMEDVTLESLIYAMSITYDVEDQDVDGDYGFIDEFTDEYFIPTAPVTMTKQWSPVAACQKLLKKPIWFDSDAVIQPSRSSAFIWGISENLFTDAGGFIDDGPFENIHDSHFRYLLALTIHRAAELKMNVMLICEPGWCYDHACEHPMGIYGYRSLRAGRLYTERVASSELRWEYMYKD